MQKIQKAHEKRKFWQWAELWLVAIILVQTAVYAVIGAKKAYFHMDEIYSYGLANYYRVQLYEDEEFYGNWHTPEYYDDYLVVNEDEQGDFAPVYENQKNDVHPPLFYLLLRLGMELTPGQFSKWTGIVLNMVIAAVNTVLIYVIIGRILGLKRGEWSARKAKALALTAVVVLGLATVSTVIYIRMYELLTMWILLTTYLHLRLLEVTPKQAKMVSKKVKNAEGKKELELDVEVGKRQWLLLLIGLVALAGVLTQYYYAFFLVALVGYFAVYYIQQKRWKEWWGYLGALAVAGAVSLVIWPWSVQHLFFSNRGGGVLERFTHPGMLLGDLWQYLGVVDKYAFHYLLLVAILGLLFLGGRALAKREKVSWKMERRRNFVMVLVPSLFYLLIVTAVSPFIELRYVAPVCGLMMMLVVMALWQVMSLVWGGGGKWRNWMMAGGIVFFAVMPVLTGVQPDTMYTERAEVVEWIQKHENVPALYLTQGKGDWVFLNDILLFRELDESYIVKDLQGREEEKQAQIQKILQRRNLSNGLIVVVNDDYDETQMIKMIENATGLQDVEHVARVVTSDVFYIKKIEP